VPKDTRQRSNVTAFELDDSVDAPPDGMNVPPLPGLWKNGQAVAAEALNMTVTEVRELMEELSLPIREVSVSERRALKSFPPPAGHIRSEPNLGHPLVAGADAGVEADLTAEPDPALLDRAVEDVARVRVDADVLEEGAGQEAS